MKKTLQIKGMHCISCEVLIEKGIKKIPGVTLEKVNHKTGKLEIDYDKAETLEKVKKVIEESDFKVLDENSKREEKDSLDILINGVSYFLLILALGSIYFLSVMFDVSRFLPDFSEITFGSAFLVGIIASLSTCLAITGGIVIGFSRFLDNSKGLGTHVKVQSLFHIGRVLGFFVLGGILGLAGSVFQISLGATAIFNTIIAILLVYLGLYTLGFVPSITKFGIHMPKSFASKLEVSRHPSYAPVVGALTFFLPCGFTQAMQLIAVNSGSFMMGGLIMMLFALGTVPVLFSIGLGSSYFKDKKFNFVNKFIGVVLVLFGIFTLSNASNFVGISSNTPKEDVTVESEVVNSQKPGEYETVNVGHDGWQTEPSTIRLKAGRNYRLTITPTSDGKGCMFAMLIPKLDETIHYIKEGEKIEYTFDNIKKGKYNIVCSAMGMRQGVIIVE